MDAYFFSKQLLDKMAKLSPKVEIINHFDNLINRVDIDDCLQKYNNEQVLCELLKSTEKNRRKFRDHYYFNVEFFLPFKYSKHYSIFIFIFFINLLNLGFLPVCFLKRALFTI